ncbi:MAG: type III pantothenate kinase [Synergistetes bacterium]|nr:type III pantothenate kinase [Synergistota bacterium]
MLLVMDVGNTNTVLGVFEDENLLTSWRISTERKRMSDEYLAILDTLLRQAHISTDYIDGIMVSSVVPQIDRNLKECCRKLFSSTPIFVRADMDLGIRVDYNPPAGVGADRLVNAVAAYFIYGAPVIVVDFGTASTFCAIDKDGVYRGGAIAPGLLISRDALFSYTARLPSVSLEVPACSIGRNVVDSIRSGLVMGFAGMVEGMVKRFKKELSENAKVVATGGLIELVATQTEVIDVIDKELTLKGLRIIYERVK